MKIRMIFGTFLVQGEKKIELPCEAILDVQEEDAEVLIAEGRAEEVE